MTVFFTENTDLTDVDGLIIETNEIPTFKPIVYDNGMLRLVLKGKM